MTMPDSDSTVAQLVSQVLTKQGEQGEKLARIDERLQSWQDVPLRVRDVELKLAEINGGRDTWARVISILSVLIALAAVAAVVFRGG
jgi:hypothetical protein